jgi:porphobilinogen synthase
MSSLPLIQRPRRLRTSAALRALVRETVLLPSDFILPLFVSEKLSAPVPVASMPGVFQLSEAALIEEALNAGASTPSSQ